VEAPARARAVRVPRLASGRSDERCVVRTDRAADERKYQAKCLAEAETLRKRRRGKREPFTLPGPTTEEIVKFREERSALERKNREDVVIALQREEARRAAEIRRKAGLGANDEQALAIMAEAHDEETVSIGFREDQVSRRALAASASHAQCGLAAV
jgi:hypothetical protein